MYCSHCKNWEIGDSDFYCSWCGKSVRELTARFIQPSIFYRENQKETIETSLILENSGSIGKVTVKKAESDQSWIKINDEAVRGKEINKQTEKVPVIIDFKSLPEDFQTATVKVETEDAGTATAQLSILPNPKHSWEDKLHTLYVENDQTNCTLPINLYLEKGVLTIKNVRIIDSDWAKVNFNNSADGGIKLDSRKDKGYTIPILVDIQKVRDSSGQFLKNYKLNLGIKFDEFQVERTHFIHFNCLIPPKLQIVEQIEGNSQLEVFHHETEEFILHLQNGSKNESGRMTVNIKNIKTDPSWLELLKPKSEFPLSIKSGEREKLEFRIEADKVGASEGKATIVLETDPPLLEKDLTLRPITVRVTEKPIYEGWLCIDFGTTNTCVGKSDFDENGDPILLEIDEGTNIITSSVIQYHDLKDDKRIYTIGSYPYSRLYTSDNEGTIVDQIKRRLGRNEILNVRLSDRRNTPDDISIKLTPKEIATDRSLKGYWFTPKKNCAQKLSAVPFLILHDLTSYSWMICAKLSAKPSSRLRFLIKTLCFFMSRWQRQLII